jgi:carboxyl-terminal processing protease
VFRRRGRHSSVALLALVAIVALIAGIVLGGHPTALPGFVRNTLVGDKDTRVVREAIDKVHSDYYRGIPRKTLADAAIAGMVKSLDDRFSQYFDPASYRHFKLLTDSAYEGIGMTVAPAKRGLRVVTVFDGSPAKRIGIRGGDLILSAAGKSLAGRSVEQGSNLIKGPPGSDVKLRVLHRGRVRRLTVERARVTVPVVASALRRVGGHKLGVVRLATFSSGAHGEVDNALERLKKRGAQGYVLDLRANGGGLVDEAQLVASAFLRGGPIVTTRGRAVPKRTLDAKGDPVVPSAPTVVLVDRDTASASEIVTGALQDRHRATVVGTRTFGKGVFQQILELSNGGALDITAGQYFTPKGRNLGGRGVHTGAGIEPDVRARDDPKTARDEALAVALRVLLRKLK